MWNLPKRDRAQIVDLTQMDYKVQISRYWRNLIKYQYVEIYGNLWNVLSTIAWEDFESMNYTSICIQVVEL